MSDGGYAPDKILAHPGWIERARHGGVLYPRHLHLVLSDLCDLACPGCSYRLPDYSSSERFWKPMADGTRNYNPNRMLPTPLVKRVLDDCAEIGTKGVEFSIEANERIPVVDRSERCFSTPIGTFVDQAFSHPASGAPERADLRGKGWRAFAIADDGSIVLDEITDVHRHRAIEPLLEVVLTDGRSTVVTASHSINVIVGTELRKVPVGALQPGDLIACANWIAPTNAPTTIDVPTHEDRNAHLVKDTPDRIAVTPELFRLLGYYTAEGSAAGKSRQGDYHNTLLWCFGTGPRDAGYRQDTIAIIERLFGLTAEIVQDAEGRLVRVQLCSTRIARLFIESLDAGGTQIKRSAPPIVWTAPVEHKLQYLVGLFAGDGSFRSTIDSRGFRRNSLHLKTCNKHLANEVAALIRQIGARATVVAGSNLVRAIGSRLLPRSRYYTVNVYDADSLKQLEPVLHQLEAAPIYRGGPYSSPGARRQRPFGQAAMAIPIKSIRIAEELGRPLVYDITVGTTHRFLTTTGIGAWNTGGGEPTLHRDCREIIEYAQCLGLATALVTNGLHLISKIGDAAVRTRWLRISLDAATRETFGELRPSVGGPRPENFDAVVRAIEWAARRRDELKTDCVIGVGFVVQQRNWQEIWKAASLARRCGADNIRISGLFTPTYDHYHADFRAEAMALERKAVEDLHDPPRFRVYGRYGEKMADLVGPPADPMCWYQRACTYLGGDGNLYRCCVISYSARGLLGSVTEAGGLRALWDRGATQARLQDFDARECRACQFRDRNVSIKRIVEGSDVPRAGEIVHPDFV